MNHAEKGFYGLGAREARIIRAPQPREHDSLLGIFAAIHSLSLFPASGIVCFGWALSRLLHFQCAGCVPLWFAGALLVYNVDRIKHDPADHINIPRRTERSARFRHLSAAIAAASACALVAIPLAMREWAVLALTLGGGFVCLNYSIPFFGFRLKDVPFLKTFFAPAIVTATCLALPILGQRMQVRGVYYSAASAWTCCFLFFNMILCDLRDIEGDRATGTISLPGYLGLQRTARLLILLIAVIAVLSLAAGMTAPPANALHWRLLGIAAPVYLAVIATIARTRRAEWFYEWCVEGMLFLPAVVLVAAKAL